METLENNHLKVIELTFEEKLNIDGGDRLTRAVFEAAGYAWEFYKSLGEGVSTFRESGGVR